MSSAYIAVARRLLLAVSMCASYAAATELTLPHDGWISWEVPTVADAPAWCCFGEYRRDRTPTAQTCKLDGEESGFGRYDEETTQSIRIYAHFSNGRPDRVRALAPSCPVAIENGPVPQLDDVSVDSSARWLATLLERDDHDAPLTRRLRGDVMAALAVHRSDTAQRTLANIARDDKHLDARKDAVFWVAHVRGVEGARTATSIMFDDANAAMREHAAFAVSQSKSPSIASDLIKLATTDRDSGVRGQAWFWLGQQGFTETESAIGAALTKERDEDVREQAVFALSRLPDERATQALIAVAENTDLSREDRKRAIFWLAQGGTEEALLYLDRVVTSAR